MNIIVALPIILITLFFSKGVINKLILSEEKEYDKATLAKCWAIAIGFAMIIGFLFAIAKPIARTAPAAAIFTIIVIIAIMAGLVYLMHNFDTSVLVNMVWLVLMTGFLLLTHMQALTALVHSSFFKSLILCTPVWATITAVAIMLLDSSWFWYKNGKKEKAVIVAGATAVVAVLVLIVSLFTIHFP